MEGSCGGRWINRGSEIRTENKKGRGGGAGLGQRIAKQRRGNTLPAHTLDIEMPAGCSDLLMTACTFQPSDTGGEEKKK